VDDYRARKRNESTSKHYVFNALVSSIIVPPCGERSERLRNVRLYLRRKLKENCIKIMFDVASTTAILGDAFTDITTVFAYAIPLIVGGMIALIGLGFGLRRFMKYVSGRKF
jgi:hypothetical protein